MRRSTVRAAANLAAKAMPSDEVLTDSLMSDARKNVETCARQLAEQQRLAAEAEAKKPGSFRARQFAKFVESWQERTDEAIATYDRLATEHGRPAWSPADEPQQS
ncbi:hypothetical protein [Promicromonospora sp. NPDC023805]|uniref:hypothetical protein n=1 Tax=Promicromonospora sp. NPDC023805 TaxID=3154696 RepID=UPI0033F001EA